MSRLKNHLPSWAHNHKSLGALGQDLHAPGMRACLNVEPCHLSHLFTLSPPGWRVLSSRCRRAAGCQTCWTHISVNAWRIISVQSSMDLSRPVVVQYHGHVTLILDFQGQILKMLYLRYGKADWHGTEGMWVDRMLDPHCDFELWPHPWPWPLIFKDKFWKSHNSGMGCPIDMERKGCESTECWPHVVTFNFDLTHDLDL